MRIMHNTGTCDTSMCFRVLQASIDSIAYMYYVGFLDLDLVDL